MTQKTTSSGYVSGFVPWDAVITLTQEVNRGGESRPAPGPRGSGQNGASTPSGPSHPFWTGSRPNCRAVRGNLH